MNIKHMANIELLPEIIKMIDEGHTVTLPLRGYSMRPFLEDRRDKAILKSVNTLKAGDVVLAEISPGHYVLHRIIGINNEDITLLGDGNITTENCKRERIKAIATGFFRKGRQAADTTDSLKWRLYSWIWLRLYPIRRYILFIHRQLFTNNYEKKTRV